MQLVDFHSFSGQNMFINQGCRSGSAWIHIIFGSWILIWIRISVKSWIRIQFRSQNSEAAEAQNRAVVGVDAHIGGMEAQNSTQTSGRRFLSL
jgi:hypothetical protein